MPREMTLQTIGDFAGTSDAQLIMKDLKCHLKGIEIFSDLTILLGQGQIYISVPTYSSAARVLLARVRAEAARYLVENYGHRQYQNIEYKGRKEWLYYASSAHRGYRIGIEMALTENEQKAKLWGPDYWRILQRTSKEVN